MRTKIINNGQVNSAQTYVQARLARPLLVATLALALTFTFTLAGCSFFEKSPKKTVQEFYKAVEKNDFKAIAEVATPETVELIEIFGFEIAERAVQTNKSKTVTEKIDEDNAVVKFTFEDGKEDNIYLKKVDGKWKVQI
jgi:hypothetical protein